MDELSLLEAGSIDEAVALESASTLLPAADFTASLDYIDSLASRSALALSRRDVATIATAVSSFLYLSPFLDKKAVPGPSDDGFNFSTDFRPLGDARRFDPEELVRPPRALVRSSARVVSPSNFDVPPEWKPKDPTDRRSREDQFLEEARRAYEITSRARRKGPFSRRQFSKPNQVVICLKRKIRREVMNAFGFAGRRFFKKPRYNYWSRVIC